MRRGTFEIGLVAAFAVAVWIGAAPAEAAETPSITLLTPSVTCPICQRNIRAALAGDRGVAGIEFDMTARTTRILLADTAASSDSIIEKIAAAGYVATPVTEEITVAVDGPASSGRTAAAALGRTPGVRAARIETDEDDRAARLVVTVETGRLDAAGVRAAIRRAAPNLRLR